MYVKKVLIFSLSYYPDFVGGAEVALKEITDRISDIEFHMVTLRYKKLLPKISKEGNVLVHRIGFANTGKLNKFLFQFSAAFKALSLHKKYKYDAVWAMMAHSTGVPAGLFKTFKPRVPYILTLQEGDPIPHIERTIRPLWPLFVRGFKKADIVQAISTFLGKWARTRGFKGQLEIIPNAVNTKKFAGEPIAHEGTILITTSRLVHKNAVDDVINALLFLSPTIKFQILGQGPLEADLKALVKKLNLESRVEFLGNIPNPELPRYLHAADIFIRPSRSEGMGNSFVEAFAAGLPVIATQEGGISDFLFDAKRNPEKPTTGWAVDKDSPKQIAEAVKDILANPEKVKKVTETAKALAFEKYDWDLIAKNMREKVFGRVGV